MAAQEDEISNFMLRLSGTGTTVGMAEKDIVAMSAAMAGVGIRAEAGGSAMSKVMSKINTAVKDGGENLQGFADVAGISGKEFATLWENDPYKAIMKFEGGVKKAVDQGENHKQLLGELGIKELRETDTVLRLANGNKQLADARQHANKGWKEGTALSDEAAERYKTLGSQIQLFKNELFALGRSIGSALAPALVALMKALTPVMRALSKAPDSVKLLIVALVSIPVIIAPVAFALSGFVAVLGAAATAMEGFAAAGVAGGLGTKVFGKAVTAIKNPVGATKVAVGGLGKGFLAMINPLNWLKGGFGAFTKVLKLAFTGVRALTGPIGLLITGLTLLATWLIKSYKEVKWFRDGVNGAVEIVKVFTQNIGGALINKLKDLGKWLGNLGNKAVDFGKKMANAWNKTEDGKKFAKGWKILSDDVKGAFDTMAKANKKASDTTKVLGKGVSKETKKTLGSYVKMSEGVKKEIDKIGLNGGKMTKESRKSLSDNIKKTGEEATKALKTGLDKRAKELNKFIEGSSNLSDKEKRNITDRFNEKYNKNMDDMKKLNEDIQELTEQQIKGKLTDKERKSLTKKLAERDRLTIELTAKGMKEQQAIISRMENNLKPMSVQNASEAIKANAKAEAKALKEAKKTRDSEIQNADTLLASKDITKKEHDDRVKEINKQYDKAVAATKKKSKELEKTVQEQDKNIWSKMDKDGHVYKGVEKMWKDFSNGFKNFFSAKNINGLLESFGALIAKPFRALGSMVGDWWNQGTLKASINWNFLIQKLSSSFGSISGWFVQKGQTMGAGIKTGWDNYLSTLSGWWSTLIGVLGLAWASTRQWFVNKGISMGSSIKTGWNKFTTTIGSWWSTLTGALGLAWASTKQWFVQRGLAIGGAIKNGWNTSLATVSTWWSKLTGGLASSWGTVKQWFFNKGIAIGTTLANAWSKTKELTYKVWMSIWGTVKGAWDKIWIKTSGTTGLIWSKVKTSWDWVKNKTVYVYTIVRDFIVKVWTRIWSKISSTTSLIWSKVKSSWDAVRNKTVGVYSFVRDYIAGVWNKIWSKIKNTTTYIWNKIKTTWDWIRNKTVNVYNFIRNHISNIWNAIWGKIRNVTNYIWNKIRTTWDNIRNKTSNIFNSIWKTIRNIWNNIWNFLRNTVQKIRNKIVNTWTNIKDNMRTMTNNIRNHTVGRFESMYNGAKDWIDKIGGYIDSAKGWMADKASSMGKAVANRAIDGLNLMIKGINTISKGITGSKLIDPINPVGGATIGKKLSTGTRKGRTRTNSKGQLKDPTLATVNDKGRGNGKGRNGHQELIIRQGKRIEVPQGRDVVTTLDKGDSVVSGAETQALQSQGVIPHFAKGTGSKKKDLKEMAGEKFGELLGSGAKKTDHAMDTVGSLTKSAGKAVADTADDITEGISDAMVKIGSWSVDAMDYIKNPGKLVNTVMQKMGVNFGGIPGGTGELARGAYEKLKKSLAKRVKEMLEEASTPEGGGYNPFASWTKTPGRGWAAGGHAGIDYAMPTGTKIPSPLSGKVIKAWQSPYGGGNETQVYDGAKYTHIFMHQSKQIAKQGQNIKQGETIGEVGSTGNSSGPHLHWQVNKGKGFINNHPDSINPEAWVKEAAKSGGGQNKKASAWRDDITRAAAQMKTKVSESDIKNIVSLINAESGGNAGVTQSTSLLDINTLMGNPAQGLLQYIPSTFRNYAVKGHTNIKSGFDQLLAFFNNKHWRTQFNPNGGWSPSGPRRFARGGIIEKDQLIRAGEGNRKEMVIPLTRKTRAMQLIDQAKSMMGVGPEGSVNIGQSGNLNDEKLDKLILAIGNLTKIVEDKRLVVDGESISDYTNNNLGKKMNKYGYMSGQPNG